MWLEHGYFSDREDLQASAAGQKYLAEHGLEDSEVVGEACLYHSPASLIEGGPQGSGLQHAAMGMCLAMW